MGKDSPKQPDPGSIINQQSALAHMNQFTPFGSITYGGEKKIRIPGQPDAFVPESMNMTLDPAQQRLMDQRNFAQQRMGDLGIGLAGQFSGTPPPQYQGPGQYNPVYATPGGNFNATAFAPGDFEAARGAAERSVYDRGLSLLQPEMNRQEKSLRQRLANQASRRRRRHSMLRCRGLSAGAARSFNGLRRRPSFRALARSSRGSGSSSRHTEPMSRARSRRTRRTLRSVWRRTRRNAAQAAQAHQMNAGNSLAGFQANQGQRAQQLQEILGLFGLQGVQLPQQMGQPYIEPVRQEAQQPGASPLAGIFGLAGMGLGAGFGGGFAGAQPGMDMGAGLAGLFGF